MIMTSTTDALRVPSVNFRLGLVGEENILLDWLKATLYFDICISGAAPFFGIRNFHAQPRFGYNNYDTHFAFETIVSALGSLDCRTG